MSRSLVVGSRVSTSVSQACGSMPFALAVARRLMMAAARLPAVSEPAKSQFFRLSKRFDNRNYAQLGIMQTFRLRVARWLAGRGFEFA